MLFKRTKFYDVIIIKPQIIKDKRGYFYENLKINLLCAKSNINLLS